MAENEGFTIIDPPVGPFSKTSEIEAWIRELRAMKPRNEGAILAIAEAEHWLSWREKGDDGDG